MKEPGEPHPDRTGLGVPFDARSGRKTLTPVPDSVESIVIRNTHTLDRNPSTPATLRSISGRDRQISVRVPPKTVRARVTCGSVCSIG